MQESKPLACNAGRIGGSGVLLEGRVWLPRERQPCIICLCAVGGTPNTQCCSARQMHSANIRWRSRGLGSRRLVSRTTKDHQLHAGTSCGEWSESRWRQKYLHTEKSQREPTRIHARRDQLQWRNQMEAEAQIATTEMISFSDNSQHSKNTIPG